MILEVKNLKKLYPIRKGLFYDKDRFVHALNGVSFQIKKGETLGLVGESGCGKSTLAKLILQLLDPTGGDILFQGQSILQLESKELKNVRRSIQIIFQDSLLSLNPRMSAKNLIEEPLIIHTVSCLFLSICRVLIPSSRLLLPVHHSWICRPSLLLLRPSIT